MKTKKYTLFAAVGVILIGAFLGWNYFKSSPQYSLYKIYKAVEAHNYNAFKSYVDIDSVIENLIDKVVESSKGEQTEGDEWEQLGQSLAEGLLTLMKPALKETAKEEIKKQIEKGDFKTDYKPINLLEALIQTKVKKEGKIATITLVNKEKKTFSFKMRQKEDHWQIFDMDLKLLKVQEALSSKTKDDQKTLQAKFGNRTDIGNSWFLTVDDSVLYEPESFFEKPEEGYRLVAAEVTYENTTSKTDSFSVSNFKLKDKEDHSYDSHYLGKDPVLESGELESGGKVKGFITFKILEEAEVKSIVYFGSSKTIVFNK